jgi:hypothetical protein
MRSSTKKMIGLRLSEWQLAELERSAKDQSISPTALARTFIVAGLNAQTLHERELLDRADQELEQKKIILEQLGRLEWLALGTAQAVAEQQKTSLGELVGLGKKAAAKWAEKRHQNDPD